MSIRERSATRKKMKQISIRIPEVVIDDLKRVAKHVSDEDGIEVGYQHMIRRYISRGLRKDLSRIRTAQSQEQAITRILRDMTWCQSVAHASSYPVTITPPRLEELAI